MVATKVHILVLLSLPTELAGGLTQKVSLMQRLAPTAPKIDCSTPHPKLTNFLGNPRLD